MEHQFHSQPLVRSHGSHEFDYRVYDPAYLSQNIQGLTPPTYMLLPYPMFESPSLGLNSDHSPPCRFSDAFPVEPDMLRSPWFEPHYPNLEEPDFDSRTNRQFEGRFESRFENKIGVQTSSVCQWADCGEVFSNMDDLIRHVVDGHIGSGKSSYLCLWWGCKRGFKAFPKRHKMLNHFRTHTGEKPFTCQFPTCRKSFSRPDSLATHVKTHSEVRPFVCPLPTCGRKYYHSRSLRKHLAAHAARSNSYQACIANALIDDQSDRKV
ncbi:hypothetical protein L0F63_006607 [Massospora cicadina]|nr:hypothetical protein L0F63_006607 [Massospora cicadina]